MIKFYDALEFQNYLKNQGHNVANLESRYDLESFCKENPKLNCYYQDPEYMIQGSPLVVIDEEDVASEKYIATFTAHKFVENKLVDTYEVTFEFKSSIPYENETITAIETKAWNQLWKKHKNWHKNNKNYSSFSMKLKKTNN